MSKSNAGDQVWAELTEGQKIEAVLAGRATLKQMSEGLLDGSDQLRNACREFLAQTSSSFENLPLALDQESSQADNPVIPIALAPVRRRRRTRRHPTATSARFGLPQGFAPRLHRYGRSVLLESNVYRLPDGREFIASPPTGTLGARRHLYALLTTEQYVRGKRGSVYVRTDGRIFDYSVDRSDPSAELFDTGYTIYDLERTGRYAPELRRRPRKKKRVKSPKYRRLAAAS